MSVLLKGATFQNITWLSQDLYSVLFSIPQMSCTFLFFLFVVCSLDTSQIKHWKKGLPHRFYFIPIISLKLLAFDKVFCWCIYQYQTCIWATLMSWHLWIICHSKIWRVLYRVNMLCMNQKVWVKWPKVIMHTFFNILDSALPLLMHLLCQLHQVYNVKNVKKAIFLHINN